MSDQITKMIIVKSDVASAFRVWANFENFPMFMQNIKKVTNIGEEQSHWVMQGPLGKDLEWDAYTTRFDENKRIAWSTKDNGDGDLTTSGQVTFNALPDNQTEVTVTVQYMPKGRLGTAVEKLFSNPGKMLEEDLRNFKAYLEGRHSRTGKGS